MTESATTAPGANGTGPDYTDEEIDRASAHERQIQMEGQLAICQNRIVELRVQLDRAHVRIEGLEAERRLTDERATSAQRGDLPPAPAPVNGNPNYPGDEHYDGLS